MIDFIDRGVLPFILELYGTVGYLGVAFAVALETLVAPIPSEVILPMTGWKAALTGPSPRATIAAIEPVIAFGAG